MLPPPWAPVTGDYGASHSMAWGLRLAIPISGQDWPAVWKGTLVLVVGEGALSHI